MANFTFSASANLKLTGITPLAGPPLLDKGDLNFVTTMPIAVDDKAGNTFTVNANTTATSLDLGSIVAGEALLLLTDGPLVLTLTQDFGSGPVTQNTLVNTLYMLQSSFSAISIANPSLTTAVHVAFLVAGDRIPVGTGPGVF